MYASLARFGYNIAKSLRPSKIKKAFKSGKTKFTPKGDGFDKFRDTTKKLRSSAEIKLVQLKHLKLKKLSQEQEVKLVKVIDLLIWEH